MTPQEINRAIAEELNLPCFGLKKGGYWYRPNGNGYTMQVSSAWRLTLEEAKEREYLKGSEDEHVIIWRIPDPDFFNDLNACHEMEEYVRHCEDYGSCLKGILVKHWSGLGKNVNAFSVFSWAFAFAHATAPQRCEAFLRTVGKWKE